MQLHWSAEEIKAQNFRGGLFGFSRKEVREFLKALAKIWAKMVDENKEMAQKIHVLETELAGWRARAEDIQLTRQKAESEAEKLLRETEERAEAIRIKTENWLEEVIAKVEETQRQKKNFVTAFKSALDSHYELIREEETETEPLTAKLTEVLRKPAPLSN